MPRNGESSRVSSSATPSPAALRTRSSASVGSSPRSVFSSSTNGPKGRLSSHVTRRSSSQPCGRNSASSRVLPTPGSPRMLTTWVLPLRALDQSSSSRASSSRRPVNGVREASLCPAGAEQSIRLDRLRLALHLEVSDGVAVVEVADAAPGGGGDQHLARLSRLLQTRRDVYGVAHDPRLRAVSDAPGDDEPAVQRTRSWSTAAGPSERPAILVHRERGLDGSRRVVLCVTGAPKTATTASPMNFSTNPSRCSTSSVSSANVAVIRPRSSSGSRCSAT